MGGKKEAKTTQLLQRKDPMHAAYSAGDLSSVGDEDLIEGLWKETKEETDEDS